jgi:hypothetical protein
MIINVRRTLTAIVSVCNLHVVFSKNYTEIFHVDYKGNVLSFQCKKSLDRSASMGEVDGPYLTHIVFMYQRSHHDSFEVRPCCSFLRVVWPPGVWGISFIYRLYRVWTRTEPFGTPACISRGEYSSPTTVIPNLLLEKNELISLIKLDEKCNLDSLYSKPECYVVSKAL